VATIFDLAPARGSVRVDGLDIGIVGLGTKEILELASRFPAIAQIITGRLQLEELYRSAPGAIAALIAAGTGNHDQAAEEAASGLPFGSQMALLSAIVKLTMPLGYGPFVEQMGAILGVGASEPTPPESSPRPSSS